MREPRRLRRRWLARFAAVACIVFALNTAWVVGLKMWSAVMSQAPHPMKVDAIAVLYSDFGPELDRTLRSLDGALAVRGDSWVPILCIGGNRQASGERWGKAMTRYLRQQGVSPQAIVEDDASYDTRTNIRSVLTLSRLRQFGTIAIVAHPAHAPRVRHHWRLQADREDAVIVLPLPDRSAARGVLDFWVAAQHEALAWLGLLLPDAWEDRIIRSIRR